MIDRVGRCNHRIHLDIHTVQFVYGHEYRIIQTIDEFERVHIMHFIEKIVRKKVCVRSRPYHMYNNTHHYRIQLETNRKLNKHT